MKTNDRQLTELMKEVDSGAAQLPDFQRGRLRMMESAKVAAVAVCVQNQGIQNAHRQRYRRSYRARWYRLPASSIWHTGRLC